VCRARSSSIRRQPGTGANSGPKGAPVAEADAREPPVVPGQAKRAADRRVDQAVAGDGGADGDLDRFEQALADGDGLAAGRRVEPEELGVVPKAATGLVELGELPLELVVRRRKGFGLRDTEQRRRSERRKRDRRQLCDHDVPVTATGGAAVVVGAGVVTGVCVWA